MWDNNDKCARLLSSFTLTIGLCLHRVYRIFWARKISPKIAIAEDKPFEAEDIKHVIALGIGGGCLCSLLRYRGPLEE